MTTRARSAHAGGGGPSDLPTFLIIGAAKAGTTFLYERLATHPDIYMSRIKETNFLARDLMAGNPSPVRTEADYRAQFAPGRHAIARGEASPVYLRLAEVARRAARDLPWIRVVATLRDPVERAYSDYLMLVRKGREDAPPETALVPGSSYLDGGFYYRQLRPWLDALGSERVLVVLLEDLRGTDDAWPRILTHLGVAPTGLAPHAGGAVNPGGLPRHPRLSRWLAHPALLRVAAPLTPAPVARLYDRLRARGLRPAPPLPAAVRRRLAALYRDDVEQLGAFLGRDLGHWLREPSSA
ncbi:MAG: hypothetical protein H6983_24845 [Ectothiorhodospiraceae bacterium]|nr:hypothetical protein [Ectothiorhodospiraceae bacterium]